MRRVRWIKKVRRRPEEEREHRAFGEGSQF